MQLDSKNPAIVDCMADLKLAAGRIAKVKFLNAGLHPYASDYCLVHANVFEKFKEELVKAIKEYWPSSSLPDVSDKTKAFKTPANKATMYSKMLNKKYFERAIDQLAGLDDYIMFQPTAPFLMSQDEDLSISPTIVQSPPENHKIITEKIYGPILVVESYNRHDEVVDKINARERGSNVMYYFGDTNSRLKQTLFERTRSGMFIVNDTLSPFINFNMPSGGCGDAGWGALNSKMCFESMSLMRAITERKFTSWNEPDIKYPTPDVAPEKFLNQNKRLLD